MFEIVGEPREQVRYSHSRHRAWLGSSHEAYQRFCEAHASLLFDDCQILSLVQVSNLSRWAWPAIPVIKNDDLCMCVLYQDLLICPMKLQLEIAILIIVSSCRLLLLRQAEWGYWHSRRSLWWATLSSSLIQILVLKIAFPFRILRNRHSVELPKQLLVWTFQKFGHIVSFLLKLCRLFQDNVRYSEKQIQSFS